MNENAGMPRLRVAAIVLRDDAILLARHRKEEKTYWVLPGGGVQYGESLEDALVREIKEEANLEVRVGRLVMANDSIPADRHRHIVNLSFTAEIIGGTLAPGSDPRLAEVRFMPLAEVPGLIFVPDTRHVLLDAIARSFAEPPAYLGNLWKQI